MKKTLSIILAIVLACGMALAVFADDTIQNSTGTSSQEVKATYESTDNTVSGTVYYVTVSWNTDDSDLTYTDGHTVYKWNAADTKYEVESTTNGEWSGSAKVAVTVTNQSNAEITATASWSPVSTFTTACTYDSDKSTVDIDSAAANTDISAGQLEGEEQTGTINATVTVSAGTITTETTIGTLTVTIAPQG